MRVASETLSSFPSLAELLTIYTSEELDKPKGSPIIDLGPLQKLESPWPRFLEYLMLMIRENNTTRGFDYACRFNRVSQDEAWRLYELFTEKKYDDDFAKAVVARTKGRTFNSLFQQSVSK